MSSEVRLRLVSFLQRGQYRCHALRRSVHLLKAPADPHALRQISESDRCPSGASGRASRCIATGTDRARLTESEPSGPPRLPCGPMRGLSVEKPSDLGSFVAMSLLRSYGL